MPRKPSGQGERTKAKLLEAARAAFSERGYGATRVDDVVRRAGTSHGTFYLYFENKQDVLRALATQTAADATALASGFAAVAASPDRIGSLRAWVSGFLELYRRDWPVLQAWVQAEATAPELDRLGRTVLADVARELARAIADAPGGERVDAAVAATALVAMLERFSYFWIVRGGPFEEADVLDTMAHLLAGAIFGEDRGQVRPRLRVRRAFRAGAE